MGAAFREGNFALAEVKYAAGDIKPMVIESVGTAQKRVEIRVDNIAGVKVPVFKPVDTGAVSQDHTGLSKGGQQIARARTTFAKAVDVLVQLATLQTSFTILDAAIKVRAHASERGSRSVGGWAAWRGWAARAIRPIRVASPASVWPPATRTRGIHAHPLL